MNLHVLVKTAGKVVNKERAVELWCKLNKLQSKSADSQYTKLLAYKQYQEIFRERFLNVWEILH